MALFDILLLLFQEMCVHGKQIEIRLLFLITLAVIIVIIAVIVLVVQDIPCRNCQHRTHDSIQAAMLCYSAS